MKKFRVLTIALFVACPGAWGQKPPLLPEKDVVALAQEISGETAKRNLEGIARFHRQRGSKGFHDAAELVAERLRTYGLSDVAILQFPADGKISYGTQKSRPPWDAEVGELWELAKEGNTREIASYEAEPVALAEDSESADVTAELVDVGKGTEEGDYAGKDVKGKIVLVSVQPGAVQDLAVGKFGAMGIVSYAQNQKTAWWGENVDAIRWGHLDTFSTNKTFGFMLSLRTARNFQERLAKGEKIWLHALVKAGQHPGSYDVVTAMIPGTDAKLKEEEIAFSCHLDHQRPGANDNASGCATILEAARTLQKLIGEGKLARPARTIRFIFPPEIEGTMALLNSKPGLPKQMKAVVHMDMVGGGPETKAVFHVTRGPMSLPSFVHDVAWAFAEWVNEESYEFAATGKAAYSLVSPEGGKEPLRAEYSAYSMGSDHDVYQDSSFGIPAIYMNDWPDRYVHTNLDTPTNIDATKLKRAAFIGAASGYWLAEKHDRAELETISRWVGAGNLLIELTEGRQGADLEGTEAHNMHTYRSLYQEQIWRSARRYVGDGCAESEGPDCLGPQNKPIALMPVPGKGKAPHESRLGTKFRRALEPKGPLAVFGYDFFEAEWAKRGHTTTPGLLEYEGLWGGGEEYAFEVLNFADGRTAQEIRDVVAAEYGPVPVALVVEYLRALEEIGVVEEIK